MSMVLKITGKSTKPFLDYDKKKLSKKELDAMDEDHKDYLKACGADPLNDNLDD